MSGWRTSAPGHPTQPETGPRFRTGVTRVPLQGLTGSHAYAQGKDGGVNAGGGQRTQRGLRAVGHRGREVDHRGASFGETTRYRARNSVRSSGTSQGISRARYYPGGQAREGQTVAQPGSLRLLGAQMVGGEGIKERADFLAMAVSSGSPCTIGPDENVYPRPSGPSRAHRGGRQTASTPNRRTTCRSLNGSVLLSVATAQLRALPADRGRRRVSPGQPRRPRT